MRTSGCSASSKPSPKNSKKGFIQHHFYKKSGAIADLPSTTLKTKSGAGFTLIEILVTLSILATLSAVLVGYASESSRQTSMMIARERVIRLFARARSLSTSTYSVNVGGSSQLKICGYGLHIDRVVGKLFLFQKIATDCSTANYQYTPETDTPLTGTLDSYSLDLNRVQFVTDPNGDLGDVVFVPPNPDTHVINAGGAVVTQAGVKLQIKDGSGYTAEVNINNAGQIKWK